MYEGDQFMRVTQRDIAKKLQLSISLVAGVLNERPNVWASEENRKRILNTAKEMNYRPNAAARALRSGRTNTVACLFINSPGQHAIVEVLAETLANIGYDLLVKVMRDHEQAQRRIKNLISRSVCDAVVLWGLEKDIEQSAMLLETEKIPFVVKGHFEESHPYWCQVDFDHIKMMEHTVKYLASLGHTRIAYLGYDHDLVYEHKLLEGFRSGMRSCVGIEVKDEYILTANDDMECTNDDTSVLERELEKILAAPREYRPTAFAMGTGLGAWHTIEKLLAKSGLKLGWEPGDITLAGMGGEDAPLLFGEGYMFKDTDVTNLANIIALRFLPKLLKGEYPESNISLFLPSFVRHASFRLSLR